MAEDMQPPSDDAVDDRVLGADQHATSVVVDDVTVGPVGQPPFLARRLVWTTIMGIVTLAFWVVSVGVGARAWLMLDQGASESSGIVAHVDAFGLAAFPWMIVAAVLTLTTVAMYLGVVAVKHLVSLVAEDEPDHDDTAAG